MEESIEDKLRKFTKNMAALEKVGADRSKKLIDKLNAEAALAVMEDSARHDALEQEMPVSKIAHFIKNRTHEERDVVREAEGQFKRVTQQYLLLVEIINGMKFEMRMMETLANNTNL